MTYSKLAFLVMVATAASAPWALAQQAPEPSAASSPPAPGAAATGASNDADEAAALIAKANAAAAANANARAASTANRSFTKVEASPEARRKAKEFGFQAEVYNGDTMFCKQDAALGTRIKSKRCMSAFEFEDYAVQLKIAREQMQSNNQCTGGICGNSDKLN